MRAQAVVDGVGAQPVAEAEPLELADRARSEAVTARLVTREDRRIGEEHVDAQPGQPGRCGRPRGPRADDDDIGLLSRGHVPDSLRAPPTLPNRARRVGCVPEGEPGLVVGHTTGASGRAGSAGGKAGPADADPASPDSISSGSISSGSISSGSISSGSI